MDADVPQISDRETRPVLDLLEHIVNNTGGASGGCATERRRTLHLLRVAITDGYQLVTI